MKNFIDNAKKNFNQAKNVAIAGGFLLLGGTEYINAQQVAKRISEIAEGTKIELFVLGNGTNGSNVVGANGFNTSSSTASGAISFNNPTGSSNMAQNTTSTSTLSLPANETISNGTFQTQNITQKTKTNFHDSSSTNTLNITITQQDSNADALEDGNTNIDLLKTTMILPHTLSDGSAIPVGTRAVIRSRDGVDLSTGDTDPAAKSLFFQRDGTTWVFKSTNRAGNAGANLPSIDANGQFLATSETTMTPAHGVKFYGTGDHQYAITDGDSSSGEKMRVKLYTMAGQMIEDRIMTEERPEQFNEPAGVYILTAEDLKTHEISSTKVRMN